MKIDKSIYIFFLLFCTIKIDAQDIFNEVTKSPESFYFQKNASNEPNLFTGCVDVKIPIYNYKDKDFNIPISLEYSMSGFNPNQREGKIGLGWNLKVGGAITREIHGVPDDSKQLKNSNLEYYGFLYATRNSETIIKASHDELFDLDYGTYNSSSYAWHIDGCEVESDVYYISAPGISGRFYIDNDGEAKCIGNTPFIIDLSEVPIVDIDGSTSAITYSRIKLTADNGYIYYFGGNPSSDLEINYSASAEELSSPVINSWMLTQIIAPNGRTVSFSYIDKDDDVINEKQYYSYTINYISNYTIQTDMIDGSTTYGPWTRSETNADTYLSYKAIKYSYLKSISINDVVLYEFNYDNKENKFYSDEPYDQSSYYPLNTEGFKLIKVVLYNNGNEYKSFNFNQEYKGNGYPRMFLTSYVESNNNSEEDIVTKFEYTIGATINNKTKYFPSPLTGGIDHWGYWNSNTEDNCSVIPKFSVLANGNCSIVGEERNANEDLCSVGMLKKVIYPTRGYSEYEYESHQYYNRVERRADYNFESHLYSEEGTAGGARIKKITEYDSNGNNVLEHEYYYDYNYGSENYSFSSGILIDWPRYGLFWVWEDKNGDGEDFAYLHYRNSSICSNYSNGQNYIHYREVADVTSGNGYVDYQFNSYYSNPDENEYKTRDYSEYTFDNIYAYNSYIGLRGNDKSFERGAIDKISIYSEDSEGDYDLIKTIENEYTSQSDYPDDFIVGIQKSRFMIQSYKMYYYPSLITKKTVNLYEKGNVITPLITAITNYEYNDLGYVISESIDNNDETITNTYDYPNEILQEGKYYDVSLLKESNIIKEPIREVRKIEKDGSIKIISGTYKEYGESSLKPENIYTLNLATPISIEDLSLNENSDYSNNFAFDFDEDADLSHSTTFNVPYSASVGTLTLNIYMTWYDSSNENNGILHVEVVKPDGSGYYYLWDYDDGTDNDGDRDIEVTKNYTLDQEGTYTVRFYYDTNDDTNFTINAECRGNISYTTTNKDVYNEIWDLENEYSYDDYGNIIEITSKQNPVVSFLWGYDHQYPIAKLVNATYTQIEEVVSEDDVQSPSTDAALRTKLAELRDALSDAQVYTYTYDPLEGMTSQTDPNGRTMYYLYDYFGHLEYVKNQDGKIIKKYEYHYAEE